MIARHFLGNLTSRTTIHLAKYEIMMFSRNTLLVAAAAIAYGASSGAAFAPSTCEFECGHMHEYFCRGRPQPLLFVSAPALCQSVCTVSTMLHSIQSTLSKQCMIILRRRFFCIQTLTTIDDNYFS